MKKENKFLLISFFVGIVYTLLFFDKEIGISFSIYIAILSLGLLYVLKNSDLQINKKAWLILIPTFLLTFRFFLSDNFILNFFNHKIIFILFISFTILLIEHFNNWASILFLSRIVERIFVPIAYLHKPYTMLYQNISFIKNLKWRSTIAKIILGIIISIPFLIVILVLLSSADSVFGHTIEFLPNQLRKIFENRNLVEYILRTVLTIFIGTYAFAFIFSMLYTNKVKYSKGFIVEHIKNIELDSVIMMTILTLVNIVYIIFCSIQFSYLFGGLNVNSILPGGLTYAEYARQGFFELLLVTIINFGILLTTINSVYKKSGIVQNILRCLLIIISTATFVMLYSSFYRMRLYEQNFGYTYLRVFVYFFLFLETIMLLGTVFYIFKNKFNLIKFYIVTFLTCFIILNYINVDRIIAKKNIDRYFTTGKIDVIYLTTLSSDAVPQITRLLNVKDNEINKQVKEYVKAKKSKLSKTVSWVEYNYSNAKALEILNRMGEQK